MIVLNTRVDSELIIIEKDQNIKNGHYCIT